METEEGYAREQEFLILPDTLTHEADFSIPTGQLSYKKKNCPVGFSAVIFIILL